MWTVNYIDLLLLQLTFYCKITLNVWLDVLQIFNSFFL